MSTFAASKSAPGIPRPDENNHPTVDDDVLNEGEKRKIPDQDFPGFEDEQESPPRESLEETGTSNYFDLRPCGDSWELSGRDGVAIANYENKEAALSAVVLIVSSEPRILRIYSANGTLEETRIYPRSAAPNAFSGRSARTPVSRPRG